MAHWLDICGGPRHLLYADNSFMVKYALLPFRVVLLSCLWLIGKLNGPASHGANTSPTSTPRMPRARQPL